MSWNGRGIWSENRGVGLGWRGWSEDGLAGMGMGAAGLGWRTGLGMGGAPLVLRHLGQPYQSGVPLLSYF